MENLELLITQNNDILTHIYTAQLFTIGCVVAVGVIFLLYKFIKQFY